MRREKAFVLYTAYDPQLKQSLISNQNIFKHSKLFPDPETWDSINQIPK